MTWTGSNVVGGVTLDLAHLNEIDVDEQKGIVHLGPGSKWSSVYAAMEQHNLTTVGGRMPEVGVAGYFLGDFFWVIIGYPTSAEILILQVVG